MKKLNTGICLAVSKEKWGCNCGDQYGGENTITVYIVLRRRR